MHVIAKEKNRKKTNKGRRTEVSYDVTGINDSKLFAMLRAAISYSEHCRYIIYQLNSNVTWW
jgi:hypothetical protein